MDMQELIDSGLIIDLKDLDIRKSYGNFVKIGLISRTIGFFIDRNNDAREITSDEFENSIRAIVPASKWRGPEKSYATSLMRKFNLIQENYARNMVENKEYLKNPMSFLFGDTSVKDNAAAIAARNYYDWSYSYEELAQITLNLQHNSLDESGAILRDGDSVASNAIYDINYIKPNTKFVRFITLENISPELLYLQIATTLGTTRYGGRTAILGDNIENNIIAIGFSKGERPISSYTVMEEAWQYDKYEPEKLLLERMNDIYGDKLLTGDDLNKIIKDAMDSLGSIDIARKVYGPVNEKIGQQWETLFSKK
ncbi:type I-D CRISPR-associated protein Cas7/Csc2 [Picrophilus oshimae]|uniref:CRISPR-associated protein Csc2 n=1 Tax=Picrophilus torridus (strain ATCC 700027 / DSM 9790 / JCM 10055 / NBRC 100828 / KAW 2/3) TaxID=1122961 RepID=Q6L359_PICTO|nr:type I-D CRISPR-associated protein Cas7/Csc2 [Picrophilus oshimae]AAT42592.1 hypothetical protein PTO0007 [Picrophilus oshimae DSM 9789]